jgi:hypothetical protein
MGMGLAAQGGSRREKLVLVASGSTGSGSDACGEMRLQVGRRDRVGAAAAATGSRLGVRERFGVEIFFLMSRASSVI